MKLPLTIIFFCSLYLSCQGQVLKDSVWIQTKEGCKVHNPNPRANETITWTGKCIDGYASDNGILTWFKGGKLNQQYIGQMKRGIPNGKGKYILSKMTVHEGDYVNGQLNGKGQITIKYKNDSVFYLYNGQLSDDVPNGFGEEIYFYSDGDTLSVYKGNFSKGDKQGPGLLKEFTYYVTTIYKGYFDLNKPQGKVEIWDHYKGKPVNYYKGDFYNGERDGYGEEVFGFNKYCGEWKKNNKNGIGKLFFDSLLIYDGDWRSGKFNGSGKRYFLDGSYYFGEFKNNQRDGIGVLSWTNGTKYIGEFEKDLFMGSGYIIKDDHVDVSGDWRNGLLATKENVMAVRNRLEEKHKGKLQQFEIKDSIKDNTLLPPR